MLSCPRVPTSFDGDVENLPGRILQTLGAFGRPRLRACQRQRYLLLCSVPSDSVGGERDQRGGLKAEILFVEMEHGGRSIRSFSLFSRSLSVFRPADSLGRGKHEERISQQLAALA